MGNCRYDERSFLISRFASHALTTGVKCGITCPGSLIAPRTLVP